MDILNQKAVFEYRLWYVSHNRDVNTPKLASKSNVNFHLTLPSLTLKRFIFRDLTFCSNKVAKDKALVSTKAIKKISPLVRPFEELFLKDFQNNKTITRHKRIVDLCYLVLIMSYRSL